MEHKCIYCNGKDPEAMVNDDWFHIECYKDRTSIAYISSTEQHKIERQELQKEADREDWLKIYCSVVEARLPHHTSSFHSSAIKSCVTYTDELHQAFKERWAEE